MIVAIGGGELGEQTAAVDEFIVQASGKSSPRVLFLPTAAKDAPGYTEKVRGHFESGNREALSPWFGEGPGREVFAIGDGAALTWDGRRHGAVSGTPGQGVWRLMGRAMEPL